MIKPELLLEVRQHRRGQMVDGNVEEALQLMLVEVDPEHAIGARL
jgi:hypothetical protein